MTRPDTRDARDDEPLGDGTSLMAFLHILKKAHAVLVGHDHAHRLYSQLRTRGDAKQYIEALMPQLLPEREKRRARRRGAHAGPHGQK
ncbi:hypothetical protein [Burkholderia sp. Ac-20353]|uniref:hypothetical protein n=1 Tax=Burkholderia sp. Ac-20353 TaxID=2703894 RepID=UPI00197B4C9F|nr:hypothetical protein [Burkholderia sp. Ac-20353]MBN3790395.1 hypothetical protein [Burkholderia sp. Ac-20353]